MFITIYFRFILKSNKSTYFQYFEVLSHHILFTWNLSNLKSFNRAKNLITHLNYKGKKTLSKAYLHASFYIVVKLLIYPLIHLNILKFLSQLSIWKLRAYFLISYSDNILKYNFRRNKFLRLWKYQWKDSIKDHIKKSSLWN